ncbi:hypothetical protein [Truepera radiovictrix]|uniref:hypothetical protein n=1 Tax=Truepera radiovictrix TaxID=332249 RepID=UPI0011D14050|nr:hypothetical protein [Truepera radiovictrix]WMT56019.1 hypothetical protein RCV51_08325 [Truepera radiovictrix]
MRRTTKAAALSAALLLGWVGAQSTPEDDLELPAFGGAQLLERSWSVDIDYDTEDFRGVFAFYDAELRRQGWEQVSLFEDDDEIDAEYRLDGLRLELESERDADGYTELELDLDEAVISEGTFSLYRWPRFELTLMPDVSVRDLDWSLDVEYATEDFVAVFDHYDGLLRGAGWERTDLSESEGEREADYVRGDFEAELEVERESGRTEVELEIDRR